MKLVTETKTKQYELTYLVSSGYTEGELKKVQEDVANLVKKHKGTIVSEENWGKKAMAYAIRKAGKTTTEAHYLHLVIELPAETAPAFEQVFSLNEAVIRHLLVVAEKADTNASQTAEKEENQEEK